MKQPWKRYIKVIMNLTLAAAVLLLCIFVLPRLLIFFLPFLIGWVIAGIANPLVRFFEEKLRIKRRTGSAFVIVSVIALVILAGYFILSKLLGMTVTIIGALPEMWEQLETEFREIGRNMNDLYDSLPVEVRDSIIKIGEKTDSYIAGLVGSIGTPTVNAVGNFARNIPNMLISVIMCLLSSYFFVAEKETIGQFCQRCIPRQIREKWRIVINSLTGAVGGYFKAQFKIEIWIFLLMLVGFLLLRISYAPVIAFLIAVLDFLPFFGAGAVMIPWAVIKALGGDYRMALWLLVIWGVGQLVRQIIQPKIVGDSVGIAPLPTLFLLFIGYKCAGVAGMILSVPIGIIVININRAGIFDNVKLSVRILVAGLNRFRRFDAEDKEVLADAEREDKGEET
ncbi:MAG: sporulation integral membrane protein YtvI [Lachnospiraceae bacterium]|nr:sporulation integral membrane protein YtvI [Lachnospiraceae bacterium]